MTEIDGTRSMRRMTIFVGVILILVGLVIGALLFLWRDDEGVACAPPCWRGITPGLTTYDEVDEKLEGANDLILDSRRSRSDGLELWLFHFSDPPPEDGFPLLGLSSTIVGRGGVVESINVSPYSPRSVQDIIHQLGPPEKISGYRTGTEFVWYEVDLYYPQRGVLFQVVVHWLLGESGVMLAPSDIAFGETYFEPRSIEGLLQPSSIHVPGTRQQQYWRDWPGFGPLVLEPELQ